MGRARISFWVFAALFGILTSDTSHSASLAGHTSTFLRSPAADLLSPDHERLRRRNKHPHAPEQVHIAICGPGSISVSWVTHPHEDPALVLPSELRPSFLLQRLNSAAHTVATALGLSQHNPAPKSCAARLKAARLPSVVQIGDQSGHYNANVSTTAKQLCYTTSDGYISGAMHYVVVGDGGEGPLDALSTYFYRVGDPELGWSDEFKFTMPREPYQQGGFPYRLGLVGDLGQTRNSAQTIDQLSLNKPDSVLNVGDLSYADGEQPRWDTYGRLVQDTAAAVPHMTIEGNHELESVDGGPKKFTAYLARWQMPYSRSGSPSALYYSYETGPAHIIMLGSYADYSPDSDQVAWLKADLASVDRARTPWLVVGMHAPWYNSNLAHQMEGERMRIVMEPLLFSYGVDVVFAGHVHAYERSDRVVNYSEEECGPVHIVIGDGGNREGLALDYLKQPHWSIFREASYGHGILDFENSTSAIWRWHRNQDGKKATADEFVLRKNPKCTSFSMSAS